MSLKFEGLFGFFFSFKLQEVPLSHYPKLEETRQQLD